MNERRLRNWLLAGVAAGSAASQRKYFDVFISVTFLASTGQPGKFRRQLLAERRQRVVCSRQIPRRDLIRRAERARDECRSIRLPATRASRWQPARPTVRLAAPAAA